MYVNFVFVWLLEAGRELEMQQDFHKSSRMS